MTPPAGSDHTLEPAFGPRPARSAVQPGGKRLVAERLNARRRRIIAIRKWVVAIALALFLAVWTVIFAQLVTGHDPALARGKSTSTAAMQSNSASSSGSGSSSASTAPTSSGSGTSSNSGAATAVTTSQS
jgi:cytoskeletal protein RodZ